MHCICVWMHDVDGWYWCVCVDVCLFYFRFRLWPNWTFVCDYSECASTTQFPIVSSDFDAFPHNFPVFFFPLVCCWWVCVRNFISSNHLLRSIFTVQWAITLIHTDTVSVCVRVWCQCIGKHIETTKIERTSERTNQKKNDQNMCTFSTSRQCTFIWRTIWNAQSASNQLLVRPMVKW